jgi:hypothetical protein
MQKSTLKRAFLLFTVSFEHEIAISCKTLLQGLILAVLIKSFQRVCAPVADAAQVRHASVNIHHALSQWGISNEAATCRQVPQA